MANANGTLNKIELIGHLGNDPELRYLPSGVGVAKFSVATERFTGQPVEGEPRQTKTDWIRVEAWDKLAELCTQYIGRGSRVFVDGSLQVDSYEKEGEKRTAFVVRANQVIFLDKPGRRGAVTDTEGVAEEEVELVGVDDGGF